MSVTARPVKGTSNKDRDKRFFVDFYEQWSGIVRVGNWADFTLILVRGEYAPYTGRWELELALLGLQVTFTYIYDRTFNDEMHDIVDEIRNERQP